ncbi:hypothetical protein [Streptomyces sp. NPDC049590]|uniref:hypothetical protein n=1 Tax=Streptomyces sp. NPDC049590 TaxID=3154834 RepID=UPI00343CF023
MRRTARALSAALAAGAVLALTGPAARAVPVPVPALCDPVVGPVPVPVPEPGALGAAPIAPGCEDARQGTGGREGGVPDGGGAPDGAGGVGDAGKEGAGPDGGGWGMPEEAGGGPDTVGPDTVGPDGAAREPGGWDGAGRDGSGEQAAGQVGGDQGGGDQGGHGCEDSRADRDTEGCRPAGVQHGVDAGAGGTFEDSVPALAAGAGLIAAACAGAGYRLYGRTRLAAARSAEM